MESPIKEYAELGYFVKINAEKNIVLVGGCFDLIHFGHYSFLSQARALGDVLIVALESDAFIEKTKSRTPIHNQHERARILSSLRYVDGVILLPYFSSDAGYNELVTQLKPAVIAVTKGDPNLAKKQAHAKGVGAIVQEASVLLPQFASSKFI